LAKTIERQSIYYFCFSGTMHKFLSLLLASACIALSFGTSAQTVAPVQPTAQPLVQLAPRVANTDKVVAPDQAKAGKKSKKKKLKKKKARQAKAQQ
jgi:hypothetical protein